MLELKKAIIMGAGPAGLSAGYELQKKGVDSVLLEAEKEVGGISKTVKYKDYHFDLGGHRFFTKFDEVNQLWKEVLGDHFKKTPRLSRIYYKNKFFNYPLTPVNALSGVGIFETASILLSYFNAKIKPDKEETFEQWVSNRFGKKLYSIFFKTYTEKVWGIPCSSIQAEWAAQRIKGLSLSSAIKNALFKTKNSSIKTLIDQFDYPTHGPGMMYNEMKNKIEKMGGNVLLDRKVSRIYHQEGRIQSIEYQDTSGNRYTQEGTHFISSVPITELVKMLYPVPPEEVIQAANHLSYRSIITVDIIVNRKNLFPDNWIYIHSPEVKLGRIQNFKNWSKDMLPDTNKTSLGLEYFCNENDDLWNKPDEDLFRFAASEVEKINICEASDIEDYTVVRVPKAYPVYMMGYKEYLGTVQEYLKKFDNLQLIGRYGLFKYNNMDHSIMTGLYAAKNILMDCLAFDTWEVNTDEEYHEEQKERPQRFRRRKVPVLGTSSTQQEVGYEK
ncbi:MAG: NAD(P)/FAD-dependent oxidoreductase [Clostridia bacterium]|nr:NAD(P)/FAD-dependent oxidoreductase [Clostridia bacterium]